MKTSIKHSITGSGYYWCGVKSNPEQGTSIWADSNCIECLKAGSKDYGPKYDFFGPLIKKLEEDLKSMKFDEEMEDLLDE